MKLIALGIIALALIVTIDSPIAPATPAAASCGGGGDSDINVCAAVCWVGEQMGWHCVD